MRKLIAIFIVCFSAVAFADYNLSEIDATSFCYNTLSNPKCKTNSKCLELVTTVADLECVFTDSSRKPLTGRVNGTFGKLSLDFEVSKGYFNGSFKAFYNNNKLASEQNFKNGTLEGDSTTYFENGQIASKGSYKEGLKEGKWEFHYENGGYDVDTYVNNQRDGEFFSYLANGTKVKHGFYKNGKIDGVLQLFDESGNITEECYYSKGTQSSDCKVFN